MSFFEGEHVISREPEHVGIGIILKRVHASWEVFFESEGKALTCSHSELDSIEHLLPKINVEKHARPFVLKGGHVMAPGDVVSYRDGSVQVFDIEDMRWCTVRTKWAVKFTELTPGIERVSAWMWLTSEPSRFTLSENRAADLLML